VRILGLTTIEKFRICVGMANRISDHNKAGEVWAIALSQNGQYLASTSFDGRINVWDSVAGRIKIREFETKGSFGMAIDLVSCSTNRRSSTDRRSSPSMADSQRPATRMGASTYSTMIPDAYSIHYQVCGCTFVKSTFSNLMQAS